MFAMAIQKCLLSMGRYVLRGNKLSMSNRRKFGSLTSLTHCGECSALSFVRSCFNRKSVRAITASAVKTAGHLVYFCSSYTDDNTHILPLTTDTTYSTKIFFGGYLFSAAGFVYYDMSKGVVTRPTNENDRNELYEEYCAYAYL